MSKVEGKYYLEDVRQNRCTMSPKHVLLVFKYKHGKKVVPYTIPYVGECLLEDTYPEPSA